MKQTILILLALAIFVSLSSAGWAAITPALPLAKATLSNPLYAGATGLVMGLILGRTGRKGRR